MQEAHHIGSRHTERGTIVIGVEGEEVGVAKIVVEEDDDLMIDIVDEPEGADRARPYAEVAHHPLRGGETELSLAETVLEVVHVDVAVAVEDDKIVLVALMIAKKDVLAVLAVEYRPVLACVVDGWGGWVLYVAELNVHLVEEVIELRLSDHEN